MKASPHRPSLVLVDLKAIQYNIKQVSDHLPKETLKWGVIKANAYGHGVLEVAQAIKDLVHGFCVSNLDEALELRQAGFSQDILVMGVTDWAALPLAIQEKITLTIASKEWLDQALSDGVDLKGLHFHIKVDSGMGRIGFRQADQINQVLRTLHEASASYQGIFTHFATADEKSQIQFQDQLARFKEMLDRLEVKAPMVHASNSATSLWHPETVFDAVRLGDIIYGLNPSGRELELPYDIRPALSLETQIVHIKELEAGQKIGYGGTYETSGSEILATLPIGYADGWTRDMQDFEVLVEGQPCPIVGRVSMDQMTIRLPRFYPLGTTVTLIGRNGDKEITATDVAAYRGTINYEVVCLLSDRLPRVYKK